jgi:hypothetical protein
MEDSPYTTVPPVKFSVIISLFRLFRETFQLLGVEMFQVRLQKKNHFNRLKINDISVTV